MGPGFRRIVALPLLLSACGPAVSTDGSASASEAEGSADDTTTGTATNATATTAGTISGDMTTTATTTATTSATATTGEPVGCATDWTTGCPSWCAAAITCDPSFGVYEECVMDCIAELGEEPPECQTAWCDAYTCWGGLDCATLMGAGSPECDALAAIADECSGGGGGPDGSCAYGCTDPDRSLTCDAMGCICEENGVEVGACPTDGICDKLEAIEEFAKACCGW
jgi:hypothetical protein